MSKTNGASSSSSSSPESKTGGGTATGLRDSDADDNFSKMLIQDLDLVEESFETVKHKASQVIAQVKEARHKFEMLRMMQPQGNGRRESSQLQELKKEVSKLKSSIPFSLIAPDSYQPNPNIINRINPHKAVLESTNPNINHNRYYIPATCKPPLNPYNNLYTLSCEEKHCLSCFLAFPKHAIIKRSTLLHFLTVSYGRYNKRFLHEHSEFMIGTVVKKDLVEAIYKKSSLTVAGYRMHPVVYSTLQLETNDMLTDYRGSFTRKFYLGRGIDEEEDIYYGESSEKFPYTKDLEILYLGKWRNSATTQHIEVADPEYFFGDKAISSKLKFISLRGISMIEELPKSITMHRNLKCLDLNACHNLEVIPPAIGNLGHSLLSLDMSNCYFLDRMPKAIKMLVSLRVLKGFFVGESTDEESCTLEDLAHNNGLLEKLNIYTSMKEFPNKSQLSALRRFSCLLSLTISWGGCSTLNGKCTLNSIDEDDIEQHKDIYDTFSFRLEKLDLQCVPETVTRHWLKPANFIYLKKLYIRGGKFYDLHQVSDSVENQWNVEILRLKYLSKLRLGWGELHRLFPKLICFENIQCPNLVQFPCDENGVWTKNASSKQAA